MRIFEVEQPPETLQQLEALHNELTQQAVILRMRYANPTGQYKNTIPDIPHVGTMTTHPGRDLVLFQTIINHIKDLKEIIERSKNSSEETIKKRAIAFRNKCYVLIHKNVMPRSKAGQTKWHMKFNERSGKLYAGKFLYGFAKEYISK